MVMQFEDGIPTRTRAGRESAPNPYVDDVKFLAENRGKRGTLPLTDADGKAVKAAEDVEKAQRRFRRLMQDAGRQNGVTVRMDFTDESVTVWAVDAITRSPKEEIVAEDPTPAEEKVARKTRTRRS